LTENELMVARSVYERKPGTGIKFRSWTLAVCGDLKLDRRDVFMMLARLEAYGLVQVVEKTPQKQSRGRERREKRGVERIERILVSPAFYKLMRFLELDG